MKRDLLCFIILIWGQSISAQNSNWETYYEKSGCQESPRYDKTVKYCKQLAEASPWVHYVSFGMSAQGRELPLLILNKKGNFDPLSVHATNNAILLIQACIHAGECDGKDAGLMLVRDIVITKKYQDLLDHLTILFIPIFNVDGHERFGSFNRINQNGPREAGWRTNAQNLNLNRDYLKAESPEIQSWLELFNEWLPDFFVDCHVTDGADYQYAATYSLEIFGNMDPRLSDWQEKTYLKEMEKEMKASGFPISPYIMFRNWDDPKSGMFAWPSPPMLSQGYTAVQNRPGLLIETHMLKDYKTRVTATYEFLKHTAVLLNKEYNNLQKLVKEADENTMNPAFRSQAFPVDFVYSKSDSTMIDFLGKEYTVEKSGLSNENWIKYGPKDQTYKLPYFNKVKPKTSVYLPEAYIIPTEWKSVIDKLQFHGIKTRILTKDTRLKVTSYKFRNYKWKSTSYEGRQTVDTECDLIEDERIFPQGSVLIDMNQRAARVIAYLLEPQASGSLLWWGYFNAIFEQKEYSENYVMEAMARKMLKDDPALETEYQKKRAEDPKFGQDPDEVLNWFYKKSPYWDKQKDVYPVGRIMDRNVVNNLLR